MTQKIRLVVCCWLGLWGAAWGQSQPSPSPQSVAISVAIKQRLPSRVAQVTIMDSIVMNPRLQALLTKFQRGLKANPQYMLDMQKRTATQGPGAMPYDKRLGMTAPELQELQALTAKREIRVAPSYAGTVAVSEKEGVIRFVGTGHLSLLNEVWIDLAKNEVYFLGHPLPYLKEVTVADAKNAFGSAWTAYEWELAEPASDTLEGLTLAKLRTLDMLLLQVQVGQLAQTGKTFLKLKGTRVDKGVKKFSFDTPLFFD
jgi:hypothetical protein